MIADRLVSTNSVWDFQIWTMLLFGCKTGLRAEELSGLKIEDFKKEVSSVSANGEVKALAFFNDNSSHIY